MKNSDKYPQNNSAVRDEVFRCSDHTGHKVFMNVLSGCRHSVSGVYVLLLNRCLAGKQVGLSSQLHLSVL